MQKYDIPQTIANQIKLIRQIHKGGILILEGDSDSRFYRQFVDNNCCKVVVAYNKENAKGTLGILEEDNIKGILTIVDADFDIAEGATSTSDNLIYTDTHDLETMLLKSPALEKLLIEYGSDNKIVSKDIRKILIEAGMKIGYLRWVSLKQGLALKFEGLDFAKFVDRDTLQIDTSKLIKEVKNHSQKQSIKDSELIQYMDSLKVVCSEPWYICCGHDLICILSEGLRKALGTNKPSNVEPEKLEKNLRLAYEKAYFLLTNLYQSIKGWEARNEQFKVV